jgi:acetyltransferase-like isoleucine patch superfamily enzyme
MKADFVAVDDPNFIGLTTTDAVCRFFNKNGIFFGRPPQTPNLTPNPTAQVRVTKHGMVEQYTLFAGNHAHPMGAFSYSHSNVATLKCGRYCSIGIGLRIFGERHPMEYVTTSNITYCFYPHWNKANFLKAHSDLMGNQWAPMSLPNQLGHISDPVLGNDVWVAETVLLARGITIGTGAVIAANSVLTKDVAPYMLYAGNPARPIRRRFSDTLCERLLRSQWWDLHPNVLFEFDARDPERFLDRVDEAREALESCPVRAFSWQDIVTEIALQDVT